MGVTTNNEKALVGMRVIDLSRAFSGPFCSMILADLGAEVIKIEHPDPKMDMAYGQAGPFAEGGVHYFTIATDRNKKSVTIDMRSREGLEVIYDLIKKSDVILDNFRPRVMEKTGLDYMTAKKLNPGIISCSITGFSPDGPYKDKIAFDIVVQAMGGAMSLTGEPGRPPLRMGLSIGDMGAGMFAAHGIMAAYIYKQKTGKGQMVSVTMLNGMTALLSTYASLYDLTEEVPGPVGSGHPSFAPHGVYKAKDGYLVISAITGDLFNNFCKAINREDLLSDPRFKTKEEIVKNKSALNEIISEVLMKKKVQEWLDTFKGDAFAFGPVNTIDKALSDPDVLLSNMVVEQDHPTGGKLKMVGNPIKMSNTPWEVYNPTPLKGQHNEAIFHDVLGYSREKIERLKKEGVSKLVNNSA